MKAFIIIFVVLCAACIVAYVADEWAERGYREEKEKRRYEDDGSDRYDL